MGNNSSLSVNGRITGSDAFSSRGFANGGLYAYADDLKMLPLTVKTYVKLARKAFKHRKSTVLQIEF
ncbi:hypothetical protein [Nostoc sp.]|uniref:hypothetical protein n=1 Tax=Nostoc sp. TaxID=1180 RepID=UPI002FF6A70D